MVAVWWCYVARESDGETQKPGAEKASLTAARDSVVYIYLTLNSVSGRKSI